MGIVLDSSVIIAAERRGHTVREILEQVKAVQGDIEIDVSVVTIAELVHGAPKPRRNSNDDIECSCGYQGPARDNACRKCGAEIPLSFEELLTPRFS